MSFRANFHNSYVKNIFLLISAIILFALQHPNFLVIEGLPFLSYFAYVPLFLLVQRLNLKELFIYGFFYGFLSYSLYAYWLVSFHPLGIAVIAGMYGLYLLIVFPILKLPFLFFDKYAWIVQWCFWCCYEYIKTLGFAGFNYGVTCYSHWQILPLIQCTNVIGIWGLSAIITFFSAWISKVITDKSIKKHLVSLFVWCFCFITIFVYGLISPVDYSKNKSKTVALIQQNSDPWVGGTAAYKRDLKVLTELSNQAMKSESNIDFIVWPETAFIPRIEYNYIKRPNRQRFELVEDLLNYIDKQNVPFVIGNDHATPKFGGGSYDYVDYNAVMLFNPGENVIPPKPQMYFKMHLVPFTEYFPFDKMFPKLYQKLLNGDTHMWEPGKDANLLNIGDFYFGTPVCFEDTFPNISRKFVNNGAKAIVNLSNDTWSNSIPCQYQHLSMAVFRSVENRISSVRATASGQTCIIDINGKVLKMAKPCEQTYLIGEFPIKDDNKTIYTLLGDYVGIGFSVISFILIIIGLFRYLVRRKNGTIISTNR